MSGEIEFQNLLLLLQEEEVTVVVVLVKGGAFNEGPQMNGVVFREEEAAAVIINFLPEQWNVVIVEGVVLIVISILLPLRRVLDHQLKKSHEDIKASEENK